MLVRCGMEHNVRAYLPHKARKSSGISHIGQDDTVVVEESVPLYFQLKGMHGRLVMVQEKHARWVKPGNLAYQLAPNGPTSARDQYDLSLYEDLRS
jgi:hypothetical protein